jgi:hypothetical protein
MLLDVADNNHAKILPDISGEDSYHKKEFTTYKYSNRKKGDLFEAVILEGKPAYLVYYGINPENGSVSSEDTIEEESRILKAPNIEAYA